MFLCEVGVNFGSRFRGMFLSLKTLKREPMLLNPKPAETQESSLPETLNPQTLNAGSPNAKP